MVAKKDKPKVVFFGSGPVASKSLELLVKDFDVEAVVTKPKPPHHKGDFPVIETAKKLGLKTHTASNKKELSALVKSDPFKSNLGILVDFGIIVGQDVINYFSKGIINSHFSVLPEWRGADPITFSVLSGQKSTGVSLMLLVEKMDEGDLISFGVYDLPKDITTPVLTDHLINFSHQMLKTEVSRYLAGAKPSPQSITGRRVSYSNKLSKKDSEIDWNKSARQIERQIRAYIEWPKSRAQLLGKDLVITKAHAVPVNHVDSKPGTVDTATGVFMVECGRGSLCIDRLVPAGKKEVSASDFLNGLRSTN